MQFDLFDQPQAHGPGERQTDIEALIAERNKMDFERIYAGEPSTEKTFELINRGYSPDVFRAGQWFEVTEDDYWYFLECLPPMDFGNGAFSMCEFATGNLTNAFAERAGKYYCLTIARASADDFDMAMRAFYAELNKEECAA